MKQETKIQILGRSAGTVIEFEPVGHDSSVVHAVELAKDSHTTWSYGRGSHECIVGWGDQGVLRLIRRGETRSSLIDALRDIERGVRGEERGLAAIFGGILAAERACAEGFDEIKGVPAFFSQMAEQRESAATQPWKAELLEENVQQCLDSVVRGGGLCRPEAGPVDSALFWLRLAERLWEENTRKRLSEVHVVGSTRRILMMLAGSWMELRPEGRILLRGSHFKLRGLARRMAWPQVMEWEAGGINRQALQYLTAYHSTYSFDGILTGLLRLDGAENTMISPAAAASVSRALLEETALNWVCDPSGSFRVDLPGHTPLTAWGVTSLRVWIVPGEGLWVALEKDEQPGASLQWTVTPPHLRRWILHENVIPAMHLTLSALWRDLKIGGREVILTDENRPKDETEQGSKRLKLYGRIRWGTEEELQRILRDAYPVEEHVRELPPGKRATRRAYKRALSQGIMLRPGTTYVRRHKRGKPDQTEENVPYKAQGLARLILASRYDNQTQNRFLTR